METLRIRILDPNHVRLITACQFATEVTREYNIDAHVISIDEHLEICRCGVANGVPALEINGHILSTGRDLDKEFFQRILSPLKNTGKKQKTTKE